MIGKRPTGKYENNIFIFFFLTVKCESLLNSVDVKIVPVFIWKALQERVTHLLILQRRNVTA